MSTEILYSMQRDFQYIAYSPPSHVLSKQKQLSTFNSNEPKTTTSRIWIYIGRCSTTSITTLMMHSRFKVSNDCPCWIESINGTTGNLWSNHNKVLVPRTSSPPAEWYVVLECLFPTRCPWSLVLPQTAFHIHIRHIQSVWAHWHAAHWHDTAAAFLSYTHPTSLRFWGSGLLVESKWCHYIKVEADSHLKLLSTSILDIYKVFEHIDMLSIGNSSSLPQLCSPWFAKILGFWLGYLWSQNDIITSWLRLTAPPQTASTIHIRHIQSVWAHRYAANQQYSSSLTQFYTSYSSIWIWSW